MPKRVERPQQEEPEATDKHQEGGIDEAIHQPCKIHLGSRKKTPISVKRKGVILDLQTTRPQQKVLLFFSVLVK